VLEVGDARIYRVQGHSLEQLTQDHRVWVSAEESHLSRAIGFKPQVEIDYTSLEIGRGDVFLLATDGVHEHIDGRFVADAIRAHASLDEVARAIVAEAYRRGSADNLTVQIVAVDEVPEHGVSEVQQQLERLAPAPLLEARAEIDGYRIVREIHASARSHLYLAVDLDSGATVALKTPATELQGD